MYLPTWGSSRGDQSVKVSGALGWNVLGRCLGVRTIASDTECMRGRYEWGRILCGRNRVVYEEEMGMCSDVTEWNKTTYSTNKCDCNWRLLSARCQRSNWFWKFRNLFNYKRALKLVFAHGRELDGRCADTELLELSPTEQTMDHNAMERDSVVRIVRIERPNLVRR